MVGFHSTSAGKHTSPMDPMGKQTNPGCVLTKSNVEFFLHLPCLFSSFWETKNLSTKTTAVVVLTTHVFS